MSLALDALKFVLEKAVSARTKGNIVDTQIFKCYCDVCLHNFDDNDGSVPAKEIVNTIFTGSKMFDSYGNPEKMYASLCVALNKILTIEEYRNYADTLLRKMVAYSELSSYVNIPVFKDKIMEDFDPDKAEFRKSHLMIFKNYNATVKILENTYESVGRAILHDVTAGTYTTQSLSSYNINLSDKIYVYTLNPQLHVKQLPESQWAADKESDKMKITVGDRCSVIIRNKPLKRKS